MAQLKDDRPIIPPESVIREFERVQVASKKIWVCYGVSKNPIDPKNLIRSSGTRYSRDGKKDWSYSWSSLHYCIKRIGLIASISDGRDKDGTYLSHDEKIIGPGIVIQRENRIFVIDLDNCIHWNEDRTYIIRSEALTLINLLGGYWEISPSGNGLHGFFIGKLPEGHITDNNHGIELYSHDHFISVTGRCIEGYTEIKNLPESLIDSFYDTYMRPYENQGNSNSEKKPKGKQAKRSNMVYDNGTSPNIEAIKNHDWQTLKKILKPEDKQYNTPGDFMDDLLQYPLDDFLGLPYGRNFRCIFHDDKQPSATINTTSDGRYYYHCFAEKKTWNIVQCVEQLGHFRFKTDSYDFVKKSLGITIVRNAWYEKQKEELQYIIDCCARLDHLGLSNQCPTVYKNVSRGLFVLQTLLIYIRDHCYSYDIGQDRIIFGITKERLTKLVCQATGRNKSDKTIHGWTQVFKVSDIIRQLPDSEIPKELLQGSIRKTGKGNRHTAFYEIEPWAVEQLHHLEQRGKEYRANKYTMTSLSYETVLAVEGEEVARKYYPQCVKDDRTVKTISRKGSAKAAERAWTVESVALDLLNRDGYFTEAGLLTEINQRCGGSIAYTELTRLKKTISRHRQDIGNKYNLVKRKCTKALKEQYEITVSGYPWIWVQDK